MVNRIRRLISKNEETTMKLELAFLCDYVDFTGRGLFNAYGAGIRTLGLNKLPDERPMALVAAIEYDPAQDSGSHVMKVRMIDSDGMDIMRPIGVRDKFPADPGFYVFYIKLCPTFNRYGVYSVELTIDDINIASLPLNVAME
jgi:hypothetical protein